MGNSDLRILAFLDEKELHEVSDSVVSVDAYNWLYKYITTTVQWADPAEYTTKDGLTEVPNIIGTLRGLPKFFQYDILPVFVFDGSAHYLKDDEIQKRKEARDERAEKALEAASNGNEQEARKLKSQSQHLTPEMEKSTRELLGILDIPVVNAPGAGEAQAAYMSQQSDVDYVVSDDYDALLFGAPETLRKFSGSGPAEQMYLRETLKSNDITHQQLIDIALLCGTDYNDGVYGIGPKKALDGVIKYGDIYGFLAEQDITINELETIRNLFSHPDSTDDYSIPSRLSPDLQSATNYSINEWGVESSLVNNEINRIKSSLS